MKKKNILILAGLLIVLGGLIYLSPEEAEEPKSDPAVDTSDWQTYVNQDFDFELMYPASDWNMVEAPEHGAAPKFNFYIKPQGVPVDTPLIHHNSLVTNVSVFPRGVPTEGLLGQSRPLEEDWGEGVSGESRIYTLEDGTPFAAYIKYDQTPESWNDSGFVFARIGSDDFEGVCFENGEEMSSDEQCDPLGDESITIRYRGEIDTSIWPELREVVKSVRFTSAE